MRFTLEESMAELSELAGTAGLEVAGSTYQRVLEPNPRTYIGTGKVHTVLFFGQKRKSYCCTTPYWSCCVYNVKWRGGLFKVCIQRQTNTATTRRRGRTWTHVPTDSIS